MKCDKTSTIDKNKLDLNSVLILEVFSKLFHGVNDNEHHFFIGE